MVVVQKKRNWTAAEDAFLQLVYYFEDTKDIANILQRSIESIQIRANKLKLSYKNKHIGSIPVSYYKRLQQVAKYRNIEFNIGIKYLADLFTKQNRKCAYSGIRIYFTASDDKQTSSLDRIDSSKGYIEGNVQWVHKNVNYMKQSLSHKKFLELVAKIYKYSGEHHESKKVRPKCDYSYQSVQV